MAVQLTEAQQMVRRVADVTGFWLDPNRIQGLDYDAALAMAEKLTARNKKRAGVRALVKKYGHDAADRIVAKHSGRHIR